MISMVLITIGWYLTYSLRWIETANGDIISIISNFGNVSVTVSGEAQDSGNLGDLIKVKNLKSGKIIKGYIKKDKKIKIFR